MNKIISTFFILIISITLLVSCKLTEKDIMGTYRLDNFPKTTIQLKIDRTFTFVKNNRNPYLHPFDHPNENYFVTKGTWTGIKKKKIKITSSTDTLIFPLVKLTKQPARDTGISNFAFYDNYGDTVKILYVQYSDSSVAMALHRSMPSFREDLTERDTLQFHFYGYRQWTFISEKKENADYAITLTPEFRPNYFNNTEFKIKRKKIIDIKRNGKFSLMPSGR